MLIIYSCDLIFLTLSGLSSSDTEYLLGLTLTGVNKGSCYGVEFVSIFSKRLFLLFGSMKAHSK